MQELEGLRREIDALDEHLLEIIQKRIVMMRAIGAAKIKLNKSIKDKAREDEKMEAVIKKAQTLQIPIKLVRKIWEAFFKSSIEIEKNE